MRVSDAFYTAVLRGISAPIGAENLRACHAWQMAEGGGAAFNPWNTTYPIPGSTWYNSFGPGGQYHVRNYQNEDDGIHATITTLTNGHYANILAAFRNGNDGHAVCVAVDASVWGTHGSVRAYVSMYGSHPVKPSPRRILKMTHPYLHGSDVRQVQEALRRHLVSPGPADGVYGPTTVHAVEVFQQARHLLPVDGIVGPQTYHALGLS